MNEMLGAARSHRITDPRVDEVLITGELREEIRAARARGYEVAFDPAQRTDPAYEQPEAILSMFHRLREGCVRFERESRARASAPHRAAAEAAAHLDRTGLVPPRLLRAATRGTRTVQEQVRREVLYSPDKIAWREQAGQAVALLTIAHAHELASERTPGLYPTMSAMLDREVYDVVFDERASEHLRGRTAQEASAHVQELSGRSALHAARSALRRMGALGEFIDQPVSEDFKNVVQFCTDSLGIRSRKERVRDLISAHAERGSGAGRHGGRLTLLSVGCGTALPILEVARALRDQGRRPTVLLLDQDPIALAAAQCLAQKPEFDMGADIELHCRRLFSRRGTALDLTPVLQGRTVDVVEDTGLREYLPPHVYRSLTRALWEALSPGGLMSTGNMNVSRPQPEFLHGLMGWQPTVRLRTIAQGFALHEASGIGRGSTTAHVTPDGVYTLFVSKK